MKVALVPFRNLEPIDCYSQEFSILNFKKEYEEKILYKSNLRTVQYSPNPNRLEDRVILTQFTVRASG